MRKREEERYSSNSIINKYKANDIIPGKEKELSLNQIINQIL